MRAAHIRMPDPRVSQVYLVEVARRAVAHLVAKSREALRPDR